MHSHCSTMEVSRFVGSMTRVRFPAVAITFLRNKCIRLHHSWMQSAEAGSLAIPAIPLIPNEVVPEDPVCVSESILNVL